MKKLSMFLAVACLSILMSMTVFAGEWKQNTTGWWYQEDDGSYPASKWETIDGNRYYFDADGYMMTGWVVSAKGNWYYFNPSGELRYDDLSEDGQVYHFDSDGRCTNHGDDGMDFEKDYQSILNQEMLEAQIRLSKQHTGSETDEGNIVHEHDVAPAKTTNRYGLADMQF